METKVDHNQIVGEVKERNKMYNTIVDVLENNIWDRNVLYAKISTRGIIKLSEVVGFKKE